MIAEIISWAALSLQRAVVNKMLSLTTSLSAKSDNSQLLHILVLERELVQFFMSKPFQQRMVSQREEG